MQHTVHQGPICNTGGMANDGTRNRQDVRKSNANIYYFPSDDLDTILIDFQQKLSESDLREIHMHLGHASTTQMKMFVREVYICNTILTL